MASVTFTERRIEAVESPLKLVEGSTVTLACTFWGTVTSPSALVYRKRKDVTSTAMPSGSASASGSVATLKPLTALVGGATYIVAVTGTVGGDTFKKIIRIYVRKDESE